MSKLLIVGEAPLEPENRGPFTNLAGRIFRKALAATNIDPERTDFSYHTTSDEIEATDSTYIVLAGNTALHIYHPELNTGHCHGRLMRTPGGVFLYPLFHHEAYARTKQWNTLLADELKVLRRIALDPEHSANYTPTTCVHCRRAAHKVTAAGVVYCKHHWRQ